MSLPSKVNDQPAYCLHRMNYGESSYILDCFTQDYGRVSVIVKGGKKRKNQADFQLFQKLSINFTGKSDLKILVGLECQYFSLSSKANIAGMYANELILYLLDKHQDSEEIFSSYQLLLSSLNNDNLEQPLRMFEYSLLMNLGVLADFTTDAKTFEPIQEQMYYSFHPEQGFYLALGKKGILGKHILAIGQQNYDKLVLVAAKQIMRQSIQWQLNGKPLKTRTLFQQLYSK